MLQSYRNQSIDLQGIWVKLNKGNSYLLNINIGFSNFWYKSIKKASNK